MVGGLRAHWHPAHEALASPLQARCCMHRARRLRWMSNLRVWPRACFVRFRARVRRLRRRICTCVWRRAGDALLHSLLGGDVRQLLLCARCGESNKWVCARQPRPRGPVADPRHGCCLSAMAGRCGFGRICAALSNWHVWPRAVQQLSVLVDGRPHFAMRCSLRRLVSSAGVVPCRMRWCGVLIMLPGPCATEPGFAELEPVDGITGIGQLLCSFGRNRKVSCRVPTQCHGGTHERCDNRFVSVSPTRFTRVDPAGGISASLAGAPNESGTIAYSRPAGRGCADPLSGSVVATTVRLGADGTLAVVLP